METAENSQENPWATGATVTVHAGRQDYLCSDGENAEERKPPRMFGICGPLPDHDGVKGNRAWKLAEKVVAPRHGFEPQLAQVIWNQQVTDVKKAEIVQSDTKNRHRYNIGTVRQRHGCGQPALVAADSGGRGYASA